MSRCRNRVYCASVARTPLSASFGTRNQSRDVIEKRFIKAKEELARIDNYEYLVINDSVEKAAEDILAVLRAGNNKKNNKK